MKHASKIRELLRPDCDLDQTTFDFFSWHTPEPSWQPTIIDVCWPLFKRCYSENYAETQALLMLARKL